MQQGRGRRSALDSVGPLEARTGFIGVSELACLGPSMFSTKTPGSEVFDLGAENWRFPAHTPQIHMKLQLHLWMHSPSSLIVVLLSEGRQLVQRLAGHALQGCIKHLLHKDSALESSRFAQWLSSSLLLRFISQVKAKT